jgi:hypothetical protein
MPIHPFCVYRCESAPLISRISTIPQFQGQGSHSSMRSRVAAPLRDCINKCDWEQHRLRSCNRRLCSSPNASAVSSQSGVCFPKRQDFSRAIIRPTAFLRFAVIKAEMCPAFQLRNYFDDRTLWSFSRTSAHSGMRPMQTPPLNLEAFMGLGVLEEKLVSRRHRQEHRCGSCKLPCLKRKVCRCDGRNRVLFVFIQ